MAGGNVSRIVHAPGQVIIGPTDLSTPGSDGSYGGTFIGKTKDAFMVTAGVPFRIESEALGEATDILQPNKQYAFVMFVRDFDDDAVRHFFAFSPKLEAATSGNYSQGVASQHAMFNEPGTATATPGASSLGRAVILLYLPDDPIHVDALLIYRGIADFPDGSEIHFSRQQEHGIPIAVDCLRDTTGNMLSQGRLADLSLI